MKINSYEIEPKDGKIYFISDLHSNLPALEAVMNEIPPDAPIFCAGDVVGYYLEPNEVCELLRSRSVLSIKGNHDKYVLGELGYPKERESKYRVEFTSTALIASNREWLSSLPEIIKLKTRYSDGKLFSSCAIEIAHGSTRNIEEYVYPDTDINFLNSENEEYLVLGHTHHPMLRSAGHRKIINPGSVGQVRDKLPGASYASFDLGSKEVTFFRASYSIGEYQNELSRSGIDDSMIAILSRVRG